jgi:hypothetical protein
MTGTDLCVNKPHCVPVIFEPPLYYQECPISCASGNENNSWVRMVSIVSITQIILHKQTSHSRPSEKPESNNLEFNKFPQYICRIFKDTQESSGQI